MNMATQTESIAWIGVGKMGLPIAGRIAAAGYRVTAFDASTERLAAAGQHGLTIAASSQGTPSGRTSGPALQGPDLLATLRACSGSRQNQPCRRHHERKLGDQTKDDADRDSREERSCERSQTSLYNKQTKKSPALGGSRHGARSHLSNRTSHNCCTAGGARPCRQFTFRRTDDDRTGGDR